MENLFEALAAICRPKNVAIGSDFIAFDFNINKAEIFTGNLTQKQIDLINSVERIESRSQFLHGMNGRQLIFEATAAYWNAEEVEEHKQYFNDERRHKPHWFIYGFFIL